MTAIPDDLPQRFPRLAEMMGIDLRSLALFRVLIGLLLLCSVLSGFADLRAFWTDAGVMPRSALVDSDGPWRLSLYLVNGQTWFVALLLLAQAVAALMFALGWRMRLASVLSFVLWVSLLNRNPLVLGAADPLFCGLLFWSMFLPLSARYSIDVALARNPPPADNRYASWATLGLLLQVMSVYFFAALLQSGREWFPEFTALHYALSIDHSTSAAGRWLLEQPALLKPLAAFVWFLELLGPPLMFLPFLLRPLRLGLLLLFALLQLGVLLSLRTGPLPLLSMAALSVFIGGWVWDRLGRWQATRQPGRAPLRLYYDRDCGFCLKSCLILRELLLLPQLQIAAAQDSARTRTLLEAKRSWVVIDRDEQAYLKWAALTVLMRRSPAFGWLWPVLRRPALARPGDAAYDFVDGRRPAFGALSAALLPQRETRWAPAPFWQPIAGAFVALLLLWNLQSAGLLPQAVQRLMAPALRVLRLDQTWNLFAPAPAHENGWWLIPARLGDGSEIDLLQPDRGEPEFGKPGGAGDGHDNVRWRAFHARLWEQQDAGHRRHYANYLCARWNRRHGDDPARRLMTLKLVYMLERTPPPGATAPIEQVIAWRHECFPEETRGRIP